MIDMFSVLEREAIIIGVIVGIVATAISFLLAGSPLALHLIVITVAGGLICGLAMLIK
ncbi:MULTISPECIES: hypothetical protein [Chloroflexus]|jgi:hypothetical protein|uniref:hypothetical protein n=1 Tax=Chloroflexus TaxID=1107 RepID=UPI0000458ED8|nr:MULTISPECIES: hypothetical protein [Chloroflexus]GIV92542.1 MAG: hypothetical protein KatS3mg056_1251 [Chloroflexus sp.]